MSDQISGTVTIPGQGTFEIPSSKKKKRAPGTVLISLTPDASQDEKNLFRQAAVHLAPKGVGFNKGTFGASNALVAAG